MTATLDETLRRADRAWLDGFLVEAYAAYQDALAIEPGSWHAAYQIAWIDSAFGPIDPDRLRALERVPASRESSSLLDELRDRAAPEWGERVGGTLRDWDLLVLRGAAEASDWLWWQSRAEACAEALPNAALASWGEAERLNPGRYAKQPHAMGAAWSRTRGHIDELAAVSRPD